MIVSRVLSASLVHPERVELIDHLSHARQVGTIVAVVCHDALHACTQATTVHEEQGIQVPTRAPLVKEGIPAFVRPESISATSSMPCHSSMVAI